MFLILVLPIIIGIIFGIWMGTLDNNVKSGLAFGLAGILLGLALGTIITVFINAGVQGTYDYSNTPISSIEAKIKIDNENGSCVAENEDNYIFTVILENGNTIIETLDKNDCILVTDHKAPYPFVTYEEHSYYKDNFWYCQIIDIPMEQYIITVPDEKYIANYGLDWREN